MHASMIIQYATSCYKIGFSDKRSHIRVLRSWGSGGSGFGLRVQGSTGSFSDGRVDLGVRVNELGVASGRIGLALVGVVLVVATILSGPRHRVGLGIQDEVLVVLVAILAVVGSGLGVRGGVLGVAERKFML